MLSCDARNEPCSPACLFKPAGKAWCCPDQSTTPRATVESTGHCGVNCIVWRVEVAIHRFIHLVCLHSLHCRCLWGLGLWRLGRLQDCQRLQQQQAAQQQVEEQQQQAEQLVSVMPLIPQELLPGLRRSARGRCALRFQAWHVSAATNMQVYIPRMLLQDGRNCHWLPVNAGGKCRLAVMHCSGSIPVLDIVYQGCVFCKAFLQGFSMPENTHPYSLHAGLGSTCSTSLTGDRRCLQETHTSLPLCCCRLQCTRSSGGLLGQATRASGKQAQMPQHMSQSLAMHNIIWILQLQHCCSCCTSL
jgi:hypothetical protein